MSANAPAPRFEPAFNQVYRADSLGYVSAWFTSGGSARIAILAGPDNPPTDLVGEANAGARSNSFVGAMIRPGEFWMLETERPGGTNYRTLFTPMS